MLKVIFKCQWSVIHQRTPLTTQILCFSAEKYSIPSGIFNNLTAIFQVSTRLSQLLSELVEDMLSEHAYMCLLQKEISAMLHVLATKGHYMQQLLFFFFSFFFVNRLSWLSFTRSDSSLIQEAIRVQLASQLSDHI